MADPTRVQVTAVPLGPTVREPCPTCGYLRAVAYVGFEVGGIPQNVAELVRCSVCEDDLTPEG